ncbi:MAG TPA: aminoacyl-histidine dipeptidase [Bacteroidota bacterium]
MSDVVKGLTPQPLWDFFAKISDIPRPSKKEQKIRAFILSVSRELALETDQDKTGNIVVRKPATNGKEKSPSVALQCHLDMVCEKNSDIEHDFERDGIQLERSNGYIRAKGTTLGSDNGIGVAAALAVMADRTTVHGPMEFLFTIDEETGLTGAHGLQRDFLKSKILLNLDSEEDGALYVGCAGGRDTLLTLTVKREKIPSEGVGFLLEMKGLSGGHSGIDIDSGRGNAIKLLARILHAIGSKTRIFSIDGGSLRNAIPREARVSIWVRKEDAGWVEGQVSMWNLTFRNEFGAVEPSLNAAVSPLNKTETEALTINDQKKIIDLLVALPHGVMRMSPDIPGLVETSTNVATIKTEREAITVGTNQRSSVRSALDEVMARVAIIGALVDARIETTDGYPGWKPNLNSTALAVTKKSHVTLFGAEPEVKAIHAGLECGIIGEKYPGIDMVSFGPTILGAHSPTERVEIRTVERFWKLLTLVLNEFAEKQEN